jgi:mannose-6-phosphate isomerase-like protein (cupin superfamily)
VSNTGELPIRRIVTGHDRSGASIFVSDGAPPTVIRPPDLGGVAINHLWQTDGTQDDLRGDDDRGCVAIQLLPPPHGSAFRIVEFPPDARLASNGLAPGADAFLTSAISPGPESAHAMMHRTPTVDFAIVLSGECYLVLDTGETLVRAGDTVIQRGVNHAWSNRSAEPCRVAFVLIDANVTP